MAAVSLFAGAGGDTLGLELAGYSVVAFSEKMPAAIATHLARFPHSVHLRTAASADVAALPDAAFKALLPSAPAVVFAGFPCQGFSKAGKKRAADPRNQLYLQWVRAARLLRPEWVIGENVPGLASMRSGPADIDPPMLDIVVRALEAEGYSVSHRILDARTYGVPQARRRLFIVGRRGSIPPSFWDAVDAARAPPRDLAFLEPSLEGATLLDADAVPHGFDDVALAVPSVATPTGTPHPYVALKAGARLLSCGKRASPVHSEVVDPARPSKTIICTYAHQPRLLVGLRSPDGRRWVRPLLVRELLQIQGFPTDYPLRGSVKDQIVQVGNAVPPALVCAVATACRTFA